MTSDSSDNTKLGVVEPAPRRSAEPPALLAHIQKQSIARTVRLLEDMFAAADDLFYDLSKRASSNNEENLYFESMREIRIRRKGIAASFSQEMKSNFDNLMNAAHPHAGHTEFEEGRLSIVESDALEIELAASNITSRGRDTYNNELYELTVRLDQSLLLVSVTEDNNPLDPQQICHAFLSSCENNLKLNIKSKLILFKVFETHVIKQLGHVYSDANQILIEAGILPKVPRSMRSRNSDSQKQERQPAYEDIDSEIPEAQDDAGQQSNNNDPNRPLTLQIDLNTLSFLMASARQGGNLLLDHNHLYNYQAYAVNPGPQMATTELANLLTQAQAIVDRQMSSLRPKNVLADIVGKLLSSRNPSVPQSVGQADEEMINLVAMFFDTLLEDENLPIATQTLICRLQIPMLKVALKDKTFLVNPKHPCRRLLNTITEAGLFFDEHRPLEKDQLYAAMVEGVHEVNKNYTTDEAIFAKVDAQISELLDKERRKSQVIERRTHEKEEGKSKVNFARATAQNALYSKMKDTVLPDAINDFLLSTWLQVLIIILIKKGKDSSDWVEAEQTIGDLIWLSQPHIDERSKQRKVRLQDTVLRNLASGLEMAIDSASARAEKIEKIRRILEQISLSKTEDDAAELSYRDLTEEERSTLGKKADGSKSWEEMTALERQQSNYAELTSKFYTQAKEMREGTWVEYLEETSGKRLRCKLSAKISADTYIFVNRLGFKALEKSRREFAYDLQTNKVRRIDVRPMFERVMTSVLHHVRGSGVQSDSH